MGTHSRQLAPYRLFFFFEQCRPTRLTEQAPQLLPSIIPPLPDARSAYTWKQSRLQSTCFSFAFWHLSRRCRSAVKRTTAVAQAFRGLFGCDVALGFGHEFVADEEFADGGAAQEWRVEVDVEVAGFDFVGGAG